MRTTKTTLIPAFTLIVILIATLAFISLNLVQSSLLNFESVVHNNNQKAKFINKMHTTARERIMSLLKMANTSDPFIRDEEWLKFNEKGADFVIYRTQLLELQLSEEESELLKKQGLITRELGPLQFRIANLLIDEKPAEGRLLISEQAIPLQDRAFAHFATFLELQEKASQQSVQTSTENYSNSQSYIIALTLSVILITLLIAVLVIRRTSESENRLRQEKERALVTLHSIGDAVITTTADTEIEAMNDVAEQLTGWSSAEASGQKLDKILHIVEEANHNRRLLPVETTLEQNTVVASEGDSLLINRMKEEFAIEYTSSPIFDGSSNVNGVVLVFRDVTSMRALAHQLSFQARHDSLTGLYNRREFEETLDQALAEVRRYKNMQYWLCYIDLDQFKVINDTCGHIAGDELLKQVSATLKRCLRDSDQIARMGGDEFAILLKHCPEQDAKTIVERILVSLQELHFYWDNKSFNTTASIGLVPVDAGSGSINDLLSAADTACYISKDAGRNRVHIYESSDETTSRRENEMQMVHRITKALETDSFSLYAQKIEALKKFDLAQHLEILVRMRDEDGNIISPINFIPSAERYNLMSKVDRWVIHNAFVLLSGYKQKNPRQKFNISLNLSAQSLCESDFLGFIQKQLAQNMIDPASICFEITETSAIANLTSATEFIYALKKLGCRFSLDDFGSGLSSFGYLKNLPVDYLKIDGSFVRDMLDDPMDEALLESINQVGHVMKIETIAEFVDSSEKLDKLRNIGVDYAQGYFIHKPCPIEEFLS